jgi:hypothetical protein
LVTVTFARLRRGAFPFALAGVVAGVSVTGFTSPSSTLASAAAPASLTSAAFRAFFSASFAAAAGEYPPAIFSPFA